MDSLEGSEQGGHVYLGSEHGDWRRMEAPLVCPSIPDLDCFDLVLKAQAPFTMHMHVSTGLGLDKLECSSNLVTTRGPNDQGTYTVAKLACIASHRVTTKSHLASAFR